MKHRSSISKSREQLCDPKLNKGIHHCKEFGRLIYSRGLAIESRRLKTALIELFGPCSHGYVNYGFILVFALGIPLVKQVLRLKRPNFG